MPAEAFAAIVIVFLIVLALVRNWGGPDTVLLAGLAGMMTLGLIWPGAFPTPAEAVRGFGNEGVITIAVLFVIAEGMRQTGASRR